MLTERREYNFWVVVRSCEIEGQWTAHILELDLVTQGNSIEHAFKMAGEAAGMVVVEDLKADRDPLTRRAPAECYAELASIVMRNTPINMPLKDMPQDPSLVVLAQMYLMVERREVRTDVPFAMKAHDEQRLCA